MVVKPAKGRDCDPSSVGEVAVFPRICFTYRRGIYRYAGLFDEGVDRTAEIPGRVNQGGSIDNRWPHGS